MTVVELARAVPPAAPVNEARAYSLEEVAALMSMSREWVYKQCRSGALRHMYVGDGRGVIRVRHTWLVEFQDAAEH